MPQRSYTVGKKVEKIMKYYDLMVDIERMWNGHTKVVPVVIEALGSIPNNL